MEKLGKFIYGLIIIAVSSLISAFVFMKLWLWILVPVFNVDEISMSIGFGLSVFVSFIKYRRTEIKEPMTVGLMTSRFGEVIGIAIFILFMGWIAGLFIS